MGRGGGPQTSSRGSRADQSVLPDGDRLVDEVVRLRSLLGDGVLEDLSLSACYNTEATTTGGRAFDAPGSTQGKAQAWTGIRPAPEIAARPSPGPPW
jgi:hypothetical protein